MDCLEIKGSRLGKWGSYTITRNAGSRVRTLKKTERVIKKKRKNIFYKNVGGGSRRFEIRCKKEGNWEKRNIDKKGKKQCIERKKTVKQNAYHSFDSIQLNFISAEGKLVEKCSYL